jgi:TolA-binding protein
MRSNGVVLIVLSAALAAAGCHKRAPVAALPPANLPSAAPASAPAPPVPSPLDDANRAFVSGSYDEAARGYEDYLRSTPSGGQRDQVLFQLALTYALRPVPGGDWQRASATLKQLIDEFPVSPLKAPANLILTLRAELDQVALDAKQRDQRIKQLTTELDRMKKIDADRRKRP